MPKKKRSWRVCPRCKSRATKILNITSGMLQCQVCDCEYDPETLEPSAPSENE